MALKSILQKLIKITKKINKIPTIMFFFTKQTNNSNGKRNMKFDTVNSTRAVKLISLIGLESVVNLCVVSIFWIQFCNPKETDVSRIGFGIRTKKLNIQSNGCKIFVPNFGGNNATGYKFGEAYRVKIQKYKKIKLSLFSLPAFLFLPAKNNLNVKSLIKVFKLPNSIFTGGKNRIRGAFKKLAPWVPLILLWVNILTLTLTKISLKLLRYLSLPTRLFVRLGLFLYSIFLGIVLTILQDIKTFLYYVIKLRGLYELLFRVEFWIFSLIFMQDLRKKYLFKDFFLEARGEFFSGLDLYSFGVSTEFLGGFGVLLLALQYGSLYYGAISSKKIMFSTYYLSIFGVLFGIWVLPEYKIFEVFLFKMGGLLLLFLFLFRGLREDTLGSKKFKIDPLRVFGDPLSFVSRKHNSILFRLRDRLHNPIIEILSFLLLSVSLYAIIEGSVPDFEKTFQFINLENLPQSLVILTIFFFIFRQPSYAFLSWLSTFSYIVLWGILTVVIYMPTGFTYAGLLSQNLVTESTGISSLGILSTPWGLEQTMLQTDDGLLSWYFGEFFTKRRTGLSEISKLDIIISTTINTLPWGDQYQQPFMLTPHDDHNWTLNSTVENTYFNNIKMLQSVSETNQADTTKYWPVERNLQMWFGEFLEKDLYYGWSHRVLIDTESYFDYSPYSITNIFGDGFVKLVFTEIFSIFSGPVELDELPSTTLNEWGSNYVPGSTTNRTLGSYTGDSENYYTQDINQRSRHNGENYHEWFPGMFVLDGMFDAKQGMFFLTILLILLVPTFSILTWFAINGRASNHFDETFGEMEMTNYNFFFLEMSKLKPYHPISEIRYLVQIMNGR